MLKELKTSWSWASRTSLQDSQGQVSKPRMIGVLQSQEISTGSPLVKKSCPLQKTLGSSWRSEQGHSSSGLCFAPVQLPAGQRGRALPFHPREKLMRSCTLRIPLETAKAFLLGASQPAGGASLLRGSCFFLTNRRNTP